MFLRYHHSLLFKNLLLKIFKNILRVTKNLYLAIFGLESLKITIFFIFKENIRYKLVILWDLEGLQH